MYSHIITPSQLLALRQSGQPVLVMDVSFDLGDTAWGAAQFAAAHIPGAVYVHLESHLSSVTPHTQLCGGRHPLPTREEFAATLQQLGATRAHQIVVYDRNGCNYCGRAWWMLHWLGHAAAAVLDGGFNAWQQAALPVEAGASAPTPSAQPFALAAARVPLVALEDVVRHLQTPCYTLVDARGAPRYRGEVEPLDHAAGHIPGALNRPFSDNFLPNGCFKPADVLRAEFEALLQGRSAGQVVAYCGSGVSATPNVLAMQLAGLPTPMLYAGSWSEWSSVQPALPCETCSPQRM